ncbi:MAG: hypothetical protein CMK32_05640 [Porticoccaceae bacterium]|nr:hypothetical protein [Porticoccaceae bacterium]
MTDSPAFIELVDSEILGLWQQELVREPGFALLDKGGVQTGQSALDQAWLYPQRSFNQFWHQLNLAPLPAASRHARHHADLAFAQLKALHQALGAPESILFALPGSFSPDQLSILLGLANALPVRTRAFVDAAVAATTSADIPDGEFLHVDIQLHQTVITKLRAGDRISREAVEPVSDTGVRAFFGGWAQHIAERFIREYRYDPLHTAESEQQLYSNLPRWLNALGTETETVAELRTPRGSFRLTLHRRALLEQSRLRLQRLRDNLDQLAPNAPVLASYRLNQLGILTEPLGATVLSEQAPFEGCKLALELAEGDSDSVDFVTHLPRGRRKPAPAPARHQAPAATHVLYRHRGYAIGTGLGIGPDGTGLAMARDTNSPVVLATQGDNIVVVRGHALVNTNAEKLRAGDTLTLFGETLYLIEIPPGG